MGEVCGTGLTAKKWAKQFIKEHGLDENDRARELIPTYGAVDTLILDDRDHNPINSVAFERLVRKGYGIVRAHRLCQKPENWRRPKADSKADKWVSKVDEEIWSRIDPIFAGKEDFTFVNKKVEDEVRTEMSREAEWMKARNKLAENSKHLGAGPTSLL